MRVPGSIPEHTFVWPLGNTVPDDEKIKVVCQIPEPEKLLKAQRSVCEAVTNELTNITRTEYHFENIHAVYALCVLRVEGVEDQDGKRVDPIRAKDKLPYYVRVNFGLDEDEHGIFQNEFGEWFRHKILREREETKKNLSSSRTPVTDTGLETNAIAGVPTSPNIGTVVSSVAPISEAGGM